MKQTRKRFILSIVTLCLVLTTGFTLYSTVHAADNNLTNGITVDSALDTADANVGDGICDDGDGNCTLRAAIEEANSDPDVSTINFNITGTADFTNGGEDGYTIAPTTDLPFITETVIINGYSQPGSQANTAIAPNPLNGRLLIEINGSNAVTNLSVFHFNTGSENSQIRGLVIGNFSNSIVIVMEASDVTVQGNYIGTNPAGAAASPNETGISHDPNTPGSGTDAIIGGLNPEDRNIISGNTDGSSAAGGYPSTGWVIQGNYIGVGADGITAIPNSTVSGSGAFSIDDCSDVLVGGDQPGSANVISGNLSYGLAPHNSPGTHIAGNYIGTDYTGTQAVPNLVGVISSGDQQDSMIGGSTIAERNIISGNAMAGVLTSNNAGTLHISGNYIGLNKSGTSAISNGSGVIIGSKTILGGGEGNRNVISGNSVFNVSVQGTLTPVSGAEVSGNYIGTNALGDIDPAITALQGEGLRISANTSENIIGGEFGNTIAGNRGAGVSVRSFTVTQFGISFAPTKSAILGNQIYGNEPGGPLTGSPGLGIDHYQATVETVSLPLDLQADSYVDLGLNTNDPTDPDTGPNNYINFPVLNSIVQDGTTATINYNLDAADSPSNEYRVEFFANDQADPSGYGEGQTFLGAITATNGTNKQASLSLPTGLNLAGKSISATTTAIDSTTASGFGATSEFSQVKLAGVAQAQPSSLAGTGQSAAPYISLSGLLTLASLALVTLRKRVIVKI